MKKGVLRNVKKFTGKHLCQSGSWNRHDQVAYVSWATQPKIATAGQQAPLLYITLYHERFRDFHK